MLHYRMYSRKMKKIWRNLMGKVERLSWQLGPKGKESGRHVSGFGRERLTSGLGDLGSNGKDKMPNVNIVQNKSEKMQRTLPRNLSVENNLVLRKGDRE